MLKSLVIDRLSRLTVDLRNNIQTAKTELDMEKKRSNELADLLHEKTKQCAKIQVEQF
jgi:hypothetical protein